MFSEQLAIQHLILEKNAFNYVCNYELSSLAAIGIHALKMKI